MSTGFRQAVCVIFLTVTAQAQSMMTGGVHGTVLDPTGAPVAAAEVIARHADTGATRKATSDNDGQFYFTALSIGNYTLTVTRDGFATMEVKPFLVSVGQVAVHRLTLQLAGVAGRIDVVEQADAIEAAATSASAALGYDRIEEAPAKSRNYLNFVSLAPGLAPSATAGPQRSMTGIRNPAADSGFTFGGLRGRNNAINIDGADNRDETTGSNRVAIGLEMVQEFQVAGVATSAEFGGAAGGMVNMVTRTGENLWHGDGTFFFQNEALNARKSEVEAATKPRSRRYQPGTSLSGPIRRDRSFFSAAIEHERESAEEWSETPAGAELVINRVLDARRFPGIPLRSVLHGLFDTGQRGTDFSFKLNHQAGQKDTLTARYAFSRGRVLNDVQGVENFQDHSASGNSLTTDHSFVGGWLRVLSASTVNDLRFQAAQRGQSMRPNSAGPMLEIPGVVSFGQAFRLNTDRTERQYEAVENFHFVAGQHRLTAGGDLHVVTLDARLANRFGGIFLFPALDAFEQGRPDVFIQAFGDPRTRMTVAPVSVWLHDRWQWKPGLRLEAGIRYDREWMPDGIPSSNNISPRLGLAWKPSVNAPLVIRAGFGLFYDRYPLAFLNEAVQKNGARAFEQYAVGDDAANIFRLTGGASLPSALAAYPRSTYRASAAFPSTYSRKFAVGVERGLGKHTTLTAEASHVRGFHLPRIRNVNGALPPRYELEQTARSDYRGLSLSLNRKLNKGATLLVVYDAGRTKDDGSDFDEQPMNPLNVRQDWARSRQHQSQRFAASGVFDIPVSIVPSKFLRELLDDLTISPAMTAGAGRPINALLTTDAYRTGAYPISARPLGMPRNPYYSPSTLSFDARLMKTIRLLHERTWLQFGVEGFNLMNHSRPVKVSEYFASTSARLPSYGGVIETGDARQLQIFTQWEF